MIKNYHCDNEGDLTRVGRNGQERFQDSGFPFWSLPFSKGGSGKSFQLRSEGKPEGYSKVGEKHETVPVKRGAGEILTALSPGRRADGREPRSPDLQ